MPLRTTTTRERKENVHGTSVAKCDADLEGGPFRYGVGLAGIVLKKLVQPVIHYSIISLSGVDNDTHEVTGGLSIYVFGHNLKWQTDAGGIISEHESGDLTSYLVRTQITLAF